MKRDPLTPGRAYARNVALFPWVRFCQNLLFWQAIWFLFLQDRLSAADAILLYAVYDVGTTLLEVPSGYLSDRVGRKITLLLAAACGAASMLLFAAAEGFVGFAAAQVLVGASIAFASGTDSAILYESLASIGRAEQAENEELRAWRYSFVALGLSAVTGGAMAWAVPVAPFVASAVAFVAMLVLVSAMREPPGAATEAAAMRGASVWSALSSALANRVLFWLLALSVAMYGFSHVPFVFGQPFIAEALGAFGLSGTAPLVSGAVSALMMLVSVLASFGATGLRKRLGLPSLLMVAFGMQVALIAVLAASNSIWAIVFLLLRMVPNALSRPFIVARIQPLLSDSIRATYLSLQSFAGRIAFAASLWLAARATPHAKDLPFNELAPVLAGYAAVGLVIWIALAASARKALAA